MFSAWGPWNHCGGRLTLVVIALGIRGRDHVWLAENVKAMHLAAGLGLVEGGRIVFAERHGCTTPDGTGLGFFFGLVDGEVKECGEIIGQWFRCIFLYFCLGSCCIPEEGGRAGIRGREGERPEGEYRWSVGPPCSLSRARVLLLLLLSASLSPLVAAHDIQQLFRSVLDGDGSGDTSSVCLKEKESASPASTPPQATVTVATRTRRPRCPRCDQVRRSVDGDRASYKPPRPMHPGAANRFSISFIMATDALVPVVRPVHDIRGAFIHIRVLLPIDTHSRYHSQTTSSTVSSVSSSAYSRPVRLSRFRLVQN